MVDKDTDNENQLPKDGAFLENEQVRKHRLIELFEAIQTSARDNCIPKPQ
jgi:hypothetical protein